MYLQSGSYSSSVCVLSVWCMHMLHVQGEHADMCTKVTSEGQRPPSIPLHLLVGRDGVPHLT